MNELFDFYEVSGLLCKTNALRGKPVCRKFTDFNSAKQFYDNLKSENVYLLEDKYLIFRSSDKKSDKIIEQFNRCSRSL